MVGVTPVAGVIGGVSLMSVVVRCVALVSTCVRIVLSRVAACAAAPFSVLSLGTLVFLPLRALVVSFRAVISEMMEFLLFGCCQTLASLDSDGIHGLGEFFMVFGVETLF